MDAVVKGLLIIVGLLLVAGIVYMAVRQPIDGCAGKNFVCHLCVFSFDGVDVLVLVTPDVVLAFFFLMKN